MSHKQMKERCPSSSFLRAVYLENAKFVYDGKSKRWNNKAVANVISADGSKVWGGLFEISEDNLAALDCYEGYPKSYAKGIVKVKDGEGNIYDAWIYFRIGQKRGEPDKDYINIVKEGANSCFLSEGREDNF